MRAAFESAGDIRSVDLLAALVALWRNKADGSLTFSRPGATAGFGLRGGELVLSISSQPQYETAAILSRAGKVDAAALQKLHRPAGGDAAIAALQAGLITEREWRWGEKIRAIEILSDLLGWLEGEYSLDSQSRPPVTDWALPVPRLVLELFLRSRDRTLVEHYLGPSDLPLLRAETFDEEFETFGLTSDAASVVALIDGRASAEEIAERAPAEEFAVLKLLAALTTLGLVHPAEAAPEPERKVPSPLRPEAREPETPVEAERELELELESESEGPGKLGARQDVEPLTEEGAPAGPSGEPPKETEKEAGPGGTEEERPYPAMPERTREEISESEREPETEPAALRPRLPEDVAPEGPPPSVPAEAAQVRIEREPAPGEMPPFDGERRRSGALLIVLLAALVVAVVVLVIARSRRGMPEQAAVTTARLTPQENPVFPPAETAVPLSARPTQAALPSSTPTRPEAIPPTSAPTAAPRPTLPPTRVPTLPPPTKPPTQIPTREPTKPPTPVPTRAEPTRPATRVPTKPEPTAPPTRVRPTAAPTAVAAVRREATRTEWIARAERDRKALSKRRNVRYAVQLELACELPTLEKAWNWDRPAGTMWLLTTSYRGRTCFRVLWGRFGSLPEAREAKTRVPDFFVAPGNRPTIVSVR